MRLIQQGDVLFFEESSLPEGVKLKKPEAGRYIFARGEATGHHHSVAVMEEVSLYEDAKGTLWCVISGDKPIEVEHQEHKPVTLQPGTYRVGIVQEVDPFREEVRQVQD